MFKVYGLNPGNRIERFIDKLLYEKFNTKYMTFEQLYEKTNKHLKIVGTNLTRSSVFYMDHKHTPSMQVSKAVRISSSVPIFYEPVKYQNEYFIDGAVLKNLDVDLFANETNVSGIAFDLKETYDVKNDTFSDYVFNIVKLMHSKLNTVKHKENIKMVEIDASFIDPLKMDLTNFEKEGTHYARTIRCSKT